MREDREDREEIHVYVCGEVDRENINTHSCKEIEELVSHC